MDLSGIYLAVIFMPQQLDGWAHQIVSPILHPKSTIFLTNICYDFFFSWQTEKKQLWAKKKLFSFSTAQTEKNS